jgi:hypothetical protein
MGRAMTAFLLCSLAQTVFLFILTNPFAQAACLALQSFTPQFPHLKFPAQTIYSARVKTP